VKLDGCTWPELAREPPPTLLIPLGATEQHGPHLPLQTDTLIAVALAERIAQARSGLIVGPALPYGASGEHAGFPGTLSLGQAALETAVVALVRSADHFDEVILLSWHGGNAAPLARATARLRHDGRRVGVWEPSLPDGDAHAGRIETSLMLAIAPALVGEQRPVGATQPLARLLPALRRDGVRAVSSSGVLGDARGASAAEGERLLAALTADLRAFLDRDRAVPAP
jgi:creatinine amidohydrolase